MLHHGCLVDSKQEKVYRTSPQDQESDWSNTKCSGNCMLLLLFSGFCTIYHCMQLERPKLKKPADWRIIERRKMEDQRDDAVARVVDIEKEDLKVSS